VYDKAGIGSSDPIDPDRDLLDQMAEAHVAILDAVGAEAAWIVGSTLSGHRKDDPTHPARALGAVLINPLPPAQFQRGVDSTVDATTPRINPLGRSCARSITTLLRVDPWPREGGRLEHGCGNLDLCAPASKMLCAG